MDQYILNPKPIYLYKHIGTWEIRMRDSGAVCMRLCQSRVMSISVKRDLMKCQKRPNVVSKETCQSRVMSM
jgi:hypothetical protein